jgi:hypothetical protein
MAAALGAELADAAFRLLALAELLRPPGIFTVSGGHSVKALTGPADQVRQDWQWQ